MGDTLILRDDIRCGFVLGNAPREQTLALARQIEAAGFDSIWVGDHISFHTPVTESLTLLSFVAAVTERVRLGTAVYLLPLRHPVVSAKVISSLDMLSGGRILLGVGVGGEFPAEFEAAGVPHRQRGARTDEAIEILRRLWTEDLVSHHGPHVEFGPIRIEPKPVRPSGPPILIGGRKGPSMRRAGRLGDGYISHMCTPEQYAENLRSIEQHARESGRPQSDFDTCAFVFMVLGNDYEAARRKAVATLGHIYRGDFDAAARRYCLLGRAEDCLEQMRRFSASGVRRFILAPLGDPTELLELAKRDILPALPTLAPVQRGLSAP